MVMVALRTILIIAVLLAALNITGNVYLAIYWRRAWVKFKAMPARAMYYSSMFIAFVSSINMVQRFAMAQHVAPHFYIAPTELIMGIAVSVYTIIQLALSRGYFTGE